MEKLDQEFRQTRRWSFAVRLACPGTAVVTSAIIALGVFTGLAFTICCGQVRDLIINITASLAAAFAYNVPRTLRRLANHLRS